MSLRADQILDRMQLKKQLLRWKIIAFAIVAGVGLLLTETYGGEHSPMEKPFIARVSIEGFVSDADELRDDALEEALNNKNIRALIVRLDTPGGSVVGGEETFHKLRAIAKVKPVVAVMRGMATSAGYMIAVGGDYIVAREGTLTGSIGVILETAEFTNLAEKIGVTPITIKSTPLKGSPGMFEKNTPEAEASLRAVVLDTYQMFVDMVAMRRGFTPEEMHTLADGRVYTGRQALKLKLVDAIGGEEDARAWLEKEKKIDNTLYIKDIEKKPKEFPTLADFMSGTARRLLGLSPHTSGLDGMLAIWHPSLQIQ
jgi:protease IV